MWQSIHNLFNSQNFMPHGFCFMWQPEVLWLHVVSDFIIFASYYSIPVALVYFARKRPDMPFRLLFGLFSLFILLCGTTHIFSIWVLWHSDYGPEGIVKALTAIVSLISAVAIWKLMPQLLMAPSPQQLQKLNAELLLKQGDIAERVHERTLQLAEANAKLEETSKYADKANKAKSDFLANMSHEIRTPMNAVIGLSTILARSEPLTPKQKEYIETLQLSATSLLSLINDLLDITKIENESVTFDNSSFSLHQLLSEVVSIMSVKAQEKNVELKMTCDKGLEGYFVGDPARLRQIFLNIISNAVKFTEKGFVKVQVTELKKAAHLKYAVISVADTGIGIPADKLDLVFEKFTQGGSDVNRKYGGSGLGLAITKRLIGLMGGTITLESEVGKGSTFIITLPLATVDEMDRVIGNVAGTAGKSLREIKARRTILLVEDYYPNILVASAVLENLGYEYDIATNGSEAIQKLSERRYDLVLMDVQMPEMDGYETTLQIREKESVSGLARIPVIGVTAFAMQGDRGKCLAAGMDDYISKPFMPDELGQKMLELINEKQAP